MKEFIALLTWPTFWQAAARLTTGIVSLVLTLILTRNLGVENFGNFTKILALVTIFYLPADFGLNAVFIKFAIAGGIKRLFFNLFLLRLFLSVILILVSLVAGVKLYGGQTAVLLTASATILTTATLNTSTAFFQLKLKFFPVFLANLVGSFLTLFLVLISSQTDLSLSNIFGAILAGQMVAVFVNFGKIWQELETFIAKIDFSLVKKYFLLSLPLGLTLIFNLVYFKADLILLSVLKPADSVGFYGLAVRIFEWAILPPVFLLNAAFPILARTFSDLDKFKKLYQGTAAMLFLAGLVVFLPLFFFSGHLVVLVGSENFAPSGAALKILALGIPIFYLTGLLMWLLVILDKRVSLVTIYGGGLVFNIIANLIFIPKFDFLASAVITVISESLILVASSIFFLKSLAKLS